ncbi:hypothetical protein A2483_05770 [Candidatus Peregrinibacteria bacterium RIFOXYC2_FULL_33_13]|nr:MAG: hypothetical protein UR27_C0010G0065 [Candidatus Peregrinibacteria bacterium GW2011_GWA2_33_10]KKP41253.1 MAG: hypothetical protein UR30_C0001G0100 [Candidatus Peregrinibacteria bacterium GW2011_GWC2_33_13]OGJ49326.1 MAG: hypothetical protein A2229_01495 [Candidatus Peregrinibacteria bacterium RIFOXYA2_FULL_33_7]OGJ52706.1 MAG: hypothetical protein A2483_05770 [Candidatus Peregrinibacteria bacterium RIFOXYC2_FULL_33_13]
MTVSQSPERQKLEVENANLKQSLPEVSTMPPLESKQALDAAKIAEEESRIKEGDPDKILIDEPSSKNSSNKSITESAEPKPNVNVESGNNSTLKPRQFKDEGAQKIYDNILRAEALHGKAKSRIEKELQLKVDAAKDEASKKKELGTINNHVDNFFGLIDSYSRLDIYIGFISDENKKNFVMSGIKSYFEFNDKGISEFAVGDTMDLKTYLDKSSKALDEAYEKAKSNLSGLNQYLATASVFLKPHAPIVSMILTWLGSGARDWFNSLLPSFFKEDSKEAKSTEEKIKSVEAEIAKVKDQSKKQTFEGTIKTLKETLKTDAKKAGEALTTLETDVKTQLEKEGKEAEYKTKFESVKKLNEDESMKDLKGKIEKKLGENKIQEKLNESEALKGQNIDEAIKVLNSVLVIKSQIEAEQKGKAGVTENQVLLKEANVFMEKVLSSCTQEQHKKILNLNSTVFLNMSEKDMREKIGDRIIVSDKEQILALQKYMKNFLQIPKFKKYNIDRSLEEVIATMIENTNDFTEFVAYLDKNAKSEDKLNFAEWNLYQKSKEKTETPKK